MPAILLLIAVLAAGHTVASALCTQNSDILFIVDGSSSVCGNDTSCPGWTSILQFIQSVSANFPIGPKATQIALIKYGDIVTTEFNLQKYKDQSSLSAAIGNVKQPGGELRYILTSAVVLTDVFNPLCGDRLLDVPNIAVVITDGMTNYPSWFTGFFSTLFQLSAGVKFFVVCTRPGCSDATAKDIASQPKAPNTQTYFFVEDYASLHGLSGEVSQQICSMSEACYKTLIPGLCPIPLM